MLYILPPPRAPDPPSPWDSILCSGTGAGNTAANTERPPWSNGSTRRPPKARLRAHLITARNDDSVGGSQDEVDIGRSSKSLSECYFAGKGAALVLPAAEAQKSSRRSGAQGSNIQKHLQSMFYLLRPEETLKMAVKLESVHPNRTRYLVVVSRMGRRAEESCLLGIDCNEKTTVGLVLRVLADTAITLDGDGGFSVSVCGRHHIFKPVSVQAMWSALQTLHKVSSKARAENYYQGGLTHSWVNYYEERIESDRSCLNEWHAMDNLESRRPPSPDSVRNKPRERDETEKVIRSTLKEIMMSVDLDEVTSKYIRGRLEEDLDMDLGEYKSFIDEEMIVILGQMDAPTEIFDHVYLGSEWNASNYEELQRNGVGHILNVTREIDNFFPGTFDYLNIRVYDDDKTDLLKHWDNTYKYISKAKKEGSKVLVHCKMGVSRSASVVIAYAMKAYNWDFKKALQHVKEKRSCIKPNTNFLQQLEMYQGMLDAMKNKEKLQRSKSETNLKSPGVVAKHDKVLVGSEPTPVVQAFARSQVLETIMSGQELRQIGSRPKSWSPDNVSATNLMLESKSPPAFRSLENLNEKSVSKESLQSLKEQKKGKETLATNVLLPCDNGESYSVSPNRIVHLPGQAISIVKERVSELESHQEKAEKAEKKKLVLNLMSQFETPVKGGGSKSASPEVDEDSSFKLSEEDSVRAQTKLSPPMLRAVLVKKEIWDPGEQPPSKVSYCNGTSDACDLHSSVSEKQTVWTSSTVLQTVSETVSAVSSSGSNTNKVPEVQTRAKTLPASRRDGDPFSNQLDKVFDREERKQQRVSVIPVLPACVTELSNEETSRECPSRQSSWSSYDSAVVLGYQGETREAPSRHSSWGSGDTRTLPSRNSSWGSYDMRPTGPVHYINEKGEKVLHSDLIENSSSGIFPYGKEDIPWYPGTVKRTKQKLEEGSCKSDLTNSSVSLDVSSETVQPDLQNSCEMPVEALNTVLINNRCALNVQNLVENQLYVSNQSAISSKLDVEDDQKLQLSRLSVSAPETSSMELVAQECSLSRSASNVSSMGKLASDASNSVISTAQCSSVKQHRTFLESLYNKNNGLSKKSDDSESDQGSNILGKVRNLKKEFEAKTNTNLSNVETNDSLKVKSRGNSMPSSPITIHQERETKGDVSPTSSEPGDFKKLIGKFESKERNTQESQVTLRAKPTNKMTQNKNTRYSCFEMSIEKNPIRITQTPLITNFNKNPIADKDNEFKRPPIPPVVRNTAPSVVVATVIAKAAKKQQQYGKSHPLARLNIKPRHNNPVYNTM